MDEKIAIELEISQRSYNLKIRQEDEWVFRKANETINAGINAYANRKDYRDKQDLMAMVLLQAVVSNIKTEEKFKELNKIKSAEQKDIQTAIEVDKLLDMALANVEK
ncbi:MAG: cell division protein ZapA [Bacteroidales bacterium]|nr:cell division protein ZapA [Bacteroidales bacterium]